MGWLQTIWQVRAHWGSLLKQSDAGMIPAWNRLNKIIVHKGLQWRLSGGQNGVLLRLGSSGMTALLKIDVDTYTLLVSRDPHMPLQACAYVMQILRHADPLSRRTDETDSSRAHWSRQTYLAAVPDAT
jgi:hypothetical protein